MRHLMPFLLAAVALPGSPDPHAAQPEPEPEPADRKAEGPPIRLRKEMTAADHKRIAAADEKRNRRATRNLATLR